MKSEFIHITYTSFNRYAGRVITFKLIHLMGMQ
jgi:hypothetical protein